MTDLHEVVISGIAGLFPECDDLDAFIPKLLDGVNLVTTENCRWPPGTLGVPNATGKMKNVYQFDLGLFGISRRLIEIMDPNTRLCIMESFRAVCDAGLDPQEISGSNTAVFMSSFTSDTEDDFITRNANLGTYGILANSRSMQANRVSFFLNLVGPSNQMDSNWCGGTQAIMLARDMIARGLCDAAIIGSSSLSLKPEMSVHYKALGCTSDDGVTRSFSADASGYARSEAVVTMFLQRARDARRSYGTILGVSTLYHGLRPTSFLEFSSENFKRFLQECYAKVGVNPNDISYLEATGTASKILDAKELNGLASVFCNNRQNPLLIGSVKSLVGHPEGAASLVSLVKALVTLDRGIIPPNINYSAPNPNVPALVSGKMQVVTKPTKFEGDLIAVNEIGLSGGGMSHIIIKRNPKPKRSDIEKFPADKTPRLVVLCDRTEENLENSINRLENSPVDEELVYLLNTLNQKGLRGNLYRGFTILDDSEGNAYKQVEKCDDKSKDDKKPVWFLFSGMGSQWPSMGKALMRIPLFAATMQRCHDSLVGYGVDLIKILVSEDPSEFDSILNCFIGIAAVQIGLVEILREVGVVPDGMIGHSTGELGCSYGDGVLTLEQTMYSAYARGRASLEAPLIRGTMAAVGMGYSNIKDQLPPTVDVACRNSAYSCTLSGPTEDMGPYIDTLKSQNVFAKLVNVGNIAYHSRYIQPAGPLLLDYLKPAIPEPKARSSKWISTSVPESQWHTKLAQFGSAEYFTNNLLSPVLFEEGAKHVPSNAILIEIAPHGLLQAIVRKSHPNATHIPLTSRFDSDNAMFLLSALGKLYINEVPVDVNKLYPPISLPVSRSTIPIGQFYSWQLLEQFTLDIKGLTLGTVSAKQVPLTMREAKYSYLSFHKINDHLILPNSYYVNEVLKQYFRVTEKKDVCVQFEGLQFFDKTDVPLGGGNCDIFIELQEATGRFCIIRGSDGAIVASGKLVEVDFPKTLDTNSKDEICAEYNGDEVNSFLGSYGLNMENKFAAIKKLSLTKTGLKAVVRWEGGFVQFLNGLFSTVGFFYTKITNVLQLVEHVELMTVDMGVFNNLDDTDFEVNYDSRTRQLKCAGIHMLLPEAKFLDADNLRCNTIFDTHRFVPYQFGEIGSGQLAVSICHQLITENALIPTDTWTKIKVISVGPNLFHDGLVALSKSSDLVELETMATEQILLEEDHSSFRGQVIWIVSAKPISTKITDSIKRHALYTYVLVPKMNETPGDSEIFTFSSSFEKYALTTIRTNTEKNVEIVRYDANYVKNLETKIVLANEKNLEKGVVTEYVYLVGKVDTLSTIHEILDDTKNLPHHNLLCYVLGESGDNSLNLENGATTKCVEKGLKMNVIFNGVWGSIRTFPEKSITAGSVVRSNDTLYSLSSVVATKEPFVLGLNLKDVTGTLENDEIGALDYANSKTMGVATYDPERKVFAADEVLKWAKPDKWSVTEAASVPFLYTLATYILDYNNAIVADNNILINRGLLPISQALITLALKRGIEVFSTVSGEEEKKQLMALHPSLNSDNILDSNSLTFHVTILRKTKGLGVYKVVNTFKEQEMIKPCLQAVCYLGVYIGVSLAPAISKLKMGMSIFISEVLAVGINPETILTLSIEEKNRLRDAVNKELVKGNITPFSKATILTSDSTNKDAEKLLKTSKNKVVVKIDGKCQDNVNVLNCSTDDNIVIVNDRSDSQSWVELCSWLSSRGARNITVVMKDTTIDGMSAMRLSTLKGKYNSLNLSFVTTESCTSEKSVKKFIDSKNNGKKLHSLFILSSGNRQLINLLVQALENIKCAVICIGNGGERICEKRNKMGLVSLSVRVGGSDAETNAIFDHLDNLLNQSKTIPIVTVKTQAAVSSGSSTVVSLVPQNLNELHQLVLSCTNKPKFVEIPTRGPRKAHSHEVLPVFVFPGLRQQQIRRIARCLYFPALEVKLPADATDIRAMATEISNEMIKMPHNMFTLLADGWGGILALHVAARLEANNKIARVILIDSRPRNIIKEATQALADPIALISRYINVPNKAKQKLNQVTSWKETVNTIIKESKLPKYEEELIVHSLDLLRNRLLGVAGASTLSQKLKRPCYLFKIGEVNTTDQCGLEKYLQSPAIIRVLVLEENSDMTEWTATEVNSLVLHENPDAAFLPKEEFLNTIFLKGKSQATL